MSRSTVPKISEQMAKPRNPPQSSLRLSMREPRKPTMGEPRNDPMPRGPTTSPAVKAV